MQSWQVSGELQSVGPWWVIWWWRRIRDRHWWKLNIWSQESESQGDDSREQGNERVSRREVMGTDNFVVGLFIFCYCLAILLRYNLHTIKFTYLKCTVQWFFSIFMELGSHHQSTLRTFLLSPKEILYPLVSFFVHLPLYPPSPRQPLIYFLSL